MATVATLQVQDLQVTRERFFEVRESADKAALKGYRQHPAYGELDMLTDHLLSTDPTAWTYL